MRGLVALTPMLCMAIAGCSHANDDARAVESQKGRWQFVGASSPYPALLIDTATGCILTLAIDPDGKIPNQLVITGTVGTPAVCGTRMDLADMQENLK